MKETENSKGIWIKYNANPKIWEYESDTDNDNESYKHLYNDLKSSNAGWEIANSLTACLEELCGEPLPNRGTRSGDIYIYYLISEINQSKMPKIKIKITNLGGKLSFNIKGAQNNLTNYQTRFDVESYLLPILIEKLKELNAPTKVIEQYENRYEHYKRLLIIQEKKELTPEEILFLYSQFEKENVLLVRKFMKNRCVQEDYDSFDLNDKKNLVNIICHLSRYDKNPSELTDFQKYTKTKPECPVLEIKEKEVLLDTVSDTEFQCFAYAKKDFRNNKDFILELLNQFESKPWHSLAGFIKYIPTEFRTDIDVLQTATKSFPAKLISIICDLTDSYNRIYDENFSNKLKEPEFTKKLLAMYINQLLLKKGRIDFDILGYLPEEVLEETNHFLYGPQPTIEMEKRKNDIGSEFSEKRNYIIRSRNNK